MGMKEAATRRSDEQKPIHHGFLTTRVLHTEREPLISQEGGKTPGQIIDERLDALRNPWRGQFGGDDREPPADWVAPVIHSITLELPTED